MPVLAARVDHPRSDRDARERELAAVRDRYETILAERNAAIRELHAQEAVVQSVDPDSRTRSVRDRPVHTVVHGTTANDGDRPRATTRPIGYASVPFRTISRTSMMRSSASSVSMASSGTSPSTLYTVSASPPMVSRAMTIRPCGIASTR
jgi:hypothetical protein